MAKYKHWQLVRIFVWDHQTNADVDNDDATSAVALVEDTNDDDAPLVSLPLDWAALQSNLPSIYARLGDQVIWDGRKPFDKSTFTWDGYAALSRIVLDDNDDGGVTAVASLYTADDDGSGVQSPVILPLDWAAMAHQMDSLTADLGDRVIWDFRSDGANAGLLAQ